MGTVYLIRHGEIAQSKPRRFLGQQDVPLTPRGREQMAQLGEFLRSRAIDRVLTSPLTRCLESADILCRRQAVASFEIVDDLREIALGSWEGKTVAEVRQHFPGEYEARGRAIATYRPAGGESFFELQRRVWPVFTAIAAGAEKKRIAIIAHAGVNRALLCRLLGMPLERLFCLSQRYGCVNEVSLGAPDWRVVTVNYCLESCSQNE